MFEDDEVSSESVLFFLLSILPSSSLDISSSLSWYVSAALRMSLTSGALNVACFACTCCKTFLELF